MKTVQLFKVVVQVHILVKDEHGNMEKAIAQPFEVAPEELPTLHSKMVPRVLEQLQQAANEAPASLARRRAGKKTTAKKSTRKSTRRKTSRKR